MSDKIKLDQETFKALAGETRVKILKSLKERKKYLSELSDELNMSNSSVKEQLDNLTEADLIKKEESDRKWKYYSLTKKGRSIITKKSTKAYVLLSSTVAASLIGLGLFLKNSVLPSIGERTEKAAATTAEEIPAETLGKTMEKPVSLLNSPGFILMAIGAIATVIITIWIIKNRRMIE